MRGTHSIYRDHAPLDGTFIIVILLELVHTTLSRGPISTQVQEFLVIGITSAVRTGLETVAARSGDTTRETGIELAITAFASLLLVVALWLVRQRLHAEHAGHGVVKKNRGSCEPHHRKGLPRDSWIIERSRLRTLGHGRRRRHLPRRKGPRTGECDARLAAEAAPSPVLLAQPAPLVGAALAFGAVAALGGGIVASTG